MKVMTFELPDGSKWAVPVEVIARDRAAHYAHEFDGDVEQILVEDTMPLFDDDPYEVVDWAANNMNWSEVKGCAFLVLAAQSPDFQEAWMNGAKEVIDIGA